MGAPGLQGDARGQHEGMREQARAGLSYHCVESDSAPHMGAVCSFRARISWLRLEKNDKHVEAVHAATLAMSMLHGIICGCPDLGSSSCLRARP
eukprot:7386855-Prymnesium_polylepis.1